MTTPAISIGLPPSPDAPDLAALAEELGFERLWLYDSAALYEDIWIHLGLIAERTSIIGLGTAVIVPNLRHVMTTASAVATVARLAPGRLQVAIGTGFTARMVLNKGALSWATTETYVRQLRGLLAGEVVEIAGEQCQMNHHPAMSDPRPIDVPLILSALGPKGQAIAAEIADGVMHVAPPDAATGGRHIHMINGTVLDDGEAQDSPRVVDAVGPWEVLGWHGAWHMAGEEIAAMLPGGADWVERVNTDRPEGERHLAVHEGHCSHVTDRDMPLLATKGSAEDPWSGWVGEAADIRARVEAAGEAGSTEILYTPAGSDLEREIRAFAAATL
ncbi:MAG: LLM class flavin-dependent oxidoreductase [Acidimicrobiales bacterium]|jgi:5,10-methylenetetrahydromethanopterin reductase|nr:LLM class flavin-dependent oxidoreductase [Acidimicrobiales bacterium]